jgi:hypothetical protein
MPHPIYGFPKIEGHNWYIMWQDRSTNHRMSFRSKKERDKHLAKMKRSTQYFNNLQWNTKLKEVI